MIFLKRKKLIYYEALVRVTGNRTAAIVCRPLLQTDRKNSGWELARSQGRSGELAPIAFWLMEKSISTQDEKILAYHHNTH